MLSPSIFCVESKQLGRSLNVSLVRKCLKSGQIIVLILWEITKLLPVLICSVGLLYFLSLKWFFLDKCVCFHCLSKAVETCKQMAAIFKVLTCTSHSGKQGQHAFDLVPVGRWEGVNCHREFYGLVLTSQQAAKVGQWPIQRTSKDKRLQANCLQFFASPCFVSTLSVIFKGRYSIST